MHTTNNVPQSRCRAFLIYGEPCKMGRWSKRRWRHAEGLFSLLTSQTREACVCVPQDTQTHSHMTLKDTITCTNASYVPPDIYWRASHCCHPFCDRRGYTLERTPSLQPTTKLRLIHPPPTHTLKLLKIIPTPSGFHKHTHVQTNPWGSTGPS